MVRLYRDHIECQTYKSHGEGQTNTKVKWQVTEKVGLNKKVSDKGSGKFLSMMNYFWILKSWCLL